MKFGEKLKKLRTEKELTPKNVAAAIDVSQRTYVSYEQDGRYPRKREIYGKLAEVPGCETNYLMTEDEEFISNAASQYGSRGKRQAEELVNELSGMFAGGKLSESDMDAVVITLQKAYFDCKKNNKIFMNARINNYLKQMILAHELGHDQRHRDIAKAVKLLKEFNLFSMKDTTEYEANAFAAHILLENEDVYTLAKQGYDVVSIAKILGADINLMLIKLQEMNHLEYEFKIPMQGEPYFFRRIKRTNQSWRK